MPFLRAGLIVLSFLDLLFLCKNLSCHAGNAIAWTSSSLDLSSFCMHGSRGCFGCCAKPTTISADDTTSKGLRVQERLVKKSTISNDIWSTSAGEMENSNQRLDPCSNAGSTGNPPEFVNRGLLLWNQTRQQWLGNKKTKNRMQVREPMISWNATYDSLLGNNKPFSRPVPLAEMVDFLVDVWDQEGLYD